jgi:hypothetical protein
VHYPTHAEIETGIEAHEFETLLKEHNSETDAMRRMLYENYAEVTYSTMFESKE